MSEENLMHEILSSIKEVISEIKVDIKDVKSDIGEIKLDVNHHILRTDLLEELGLENKKKIDALEKDAFKLKGAFALFMLLLTILGTYALFKH